MQDTGYSGYVWDRTTIRTAMVLVGLFVFGILLSLSAYEIHLNTLQRIAIEQAAGEILGTKVSIGGYYPRPKQKLIVFTEIKIENPADLHMDNPFPYQSEAIKIDVIRMKADSLSSDKMVFDEVSVENAVIRLLANRYQANLPALYAKINSKAAPGSVKTIIKKLDAENIILIPWVAQPDRNFGTKSLQPLHLKAIGEKEGGITMGEALAEIAKEICRQALMKGARADALSDMSKESLAEIQKAMNMGPHFVDIARRGTEDWGDWNTRDFQKGPDPDQIEGTRR